MYSTFSVPIKKEVKRIGKKEEEIKPKIISYKIQFVDSLGLCDSKPSL